MLWSDFDGPVTQSGLALVKAHGTKPRKKEKAYRMDSASRNIVKFIATITVAALLILAARFYAESQKQPMPSVAEEPVGSVKKSEALPAPEPTVTPAPVENSEFQNDEEIPAITGEPSVDIESNNSGQQDSPPDESDN